MKLLLFSDLHRSVPAAERLVAMAEDIDVLVGAGDFATVRRGLADTIDVLRRANCPAVFVPGNSESADELSAVCRGWSQAHVLHGSGVTIDGVPFFGMGGGVPVTPFGSWSYDFTEQQAADLLVACPDQCVLVTHSPPKDAVDLSSAGQHLGSTAVRDTIERTRPRLVVCGHIHESAGKTAVIGATTVVNAGPAGRVWQLDNPEIAGGAGH